MAVTATVSLGGLLFAVSPASAAAPDFGPNVTVFDSSWSVDQINAALMAGSREAEFGAGRHQYFFKPGAYGNDAHQDDPQNASDIINSELGYYQAVAGLGASPEDVRINGAIHVEPVRRCEANPWDCPQPGSLNNFWRSLSNLTVNPIQQPVGVDRDRALPSGATDTHQMRYAVSQAAPLRRMNIEGSLTLFGRYGEYASGGYLANSNVDDDVVSGSQQQWFSRNSTIGGWDGGVWNMVFSGVDGAPATNFGPQPGGEKGAVTTIDATPIVREAPFLYTDNDQYRVFVPAAKEETRGHDWSTDGSAGSSEPIENFLIAKEGDTAAVLNDALARGKHLLITPGVYHLSEPLRITHPRTVVLGLGYASLVPDRGTAAIEIADVPGVKVAGLTIDAGLERSSTLIQVGPNSADAADPTDPTTLSDVFIRVGGAWAGKASTSIEVNSSNVILDHVWAWRADHGAGVGWTSNTADHGVVINGDDVTALGLFVEHYQKQQVIWNGERGRTIFYQSEIPYDPPSQAAYMDGSRKGFASYRVSDSVSSHLAQGMGVYSFFDPTVNGGQDIRVASGIQTPSKPDVQFESMTSVFLNGTGGIDAIINDAGAPAVGSFAAPQLVKYPVPQPPSIAGTPPATTVGSNFDFQFIVSGAPSPTVNVTDGALPPGLELSPAGRLAGTPTAEGNHRFSLTASNGQLPAAHLDVALLVSAVDRVSGADRFETAVRIANRAYPEGAEVIFLTAGEGFADALSAGPAAAKLHGPILLTAKDELPKVVNDAIVRMKAQGTAKAVIVGGPNAISADVQDHLEALGLAVDRVAGPDRFATSRAVSHYAFPAGAEAAFIATGTNFPDALSAGAAIGEAGPVLLVDGHASAADPATRDHLTKLDVGTAYVAGGPAAVSAGIETSLTNLGVATKRLGGATRYETSQAINAELSAGAKQMLFATGTNFPDALTGASWAATLNAPLYVLPPTCVPGEILNARTAWSTERITLLGGTATLSSDVQHLMECR
jgi:putative cell wall-binding protein